MAPLLLALALAAAPALPGPADLRPLALLDVFELEHADDPRIAPDGERVVYVRAGFDVRADRRRTALWTIGFDGAAHRPLVTAGDPSSPRWSPSGDRLAFVARDGERAQLFVRWMDDGTTAAITRLDEAPADLAWSPDGRWLAFTMFVPEPPEPFCELPAPPEGAEWAPAPRVVRRMLYRADGRGWLEDGHRHAFVVPSTGGTPRQLTEGPFDHGGPLAWTPDGTALLLVANRREDVEREPRDTAVWRLAIADGALERLTERYGPEGGAVLSPDGARLAYLGYEDRHLGFQTRRATVLDLASGEEEPLAGDLDRSLDELAWTPAGLFASYSDHGVGKLARLWPERAVLAEHVGGTTIGRPYASGAWSVADDGRFAVTVTDPARPADLAVGGNGGPLRTITDLNGDLLGARDLAAVEELWTTSSADGLPVQAWVAKPPGFDPGKRYPLILEIHGGPFADYGPRFSAEVQLYAAAGYVVLYANPRGSTSYGEAFANEIHHAYPGEDYDDLMSCVDAVVERGWVDPGRLYVTGGSGGGVLTAWIVGKTDRFRAAVVAKPVIHWASWALTADNYNVYWRYWFPGPPWEEHEHYWRRSPLSLVGNVTTPTMLLTGEEDHRTPIAESEQYYQALQLRGVDTAFVRVPDASHGIAARPSHLIAKVAHVLAWFERYRTP